MANTHAYRGDGFAKKNYRDWEKFGLPLEVLQSVRSFAKGSCLVKNMTINVVDVFDDVGKYTGISLASSQKYFIDLKIQRYFKVTQRYFSFTH